MHKYSTEGSYWFKRFLNDLMSLSNSFQVKKLKHGFYRIYWRNCYVYEVYKEMPEYGFDYDDLDPRFDDKKFYEEFEDQVEITRKVKNFVEGYWEALDTIKTRLYMMRHDKEYYDNALKAYQTMVVK